MIVVSDTSPVLSLALIDRLDLLRQIYGALVIPRAVRDEIAAGQMVYANGGEIASSDWIRVEAPSNSLAIALLKRELDQGEAEALALASELQADLVLLDEYKARRLADYLDLPHTGLLDILAEAKRRHLLPAMRPILDELVTRASFRISRKLYQRILQAAGEFEHVDIP